MVLSWGWFRQRVSSPAPELLTKPPNIVNVEIKEAGDARKVALVTFDSEEVSEQENQVCREFGRMANVPGFRKGKAPPQVIRKRYSKEMQEELNRKVSTTAYEAVLEHKDIKVYSILKVDAGEVATDRPPRSKSPSTWNRTSTFPTTRHSS